MTKIIKSIGLEKNLWGKETIFVNFKKVSKFRKLVKKTRKYNKKN